MQDFLDLYFEEFGENLANLLEANPQYQITAQGYYNRIHRFIESYIKGHNPSYNFDNLLEYQQTAVKVAEVYQAFYVIHSVDFSILSGFDANSGSLVAKATLEERSIGSEAYNILRDAEVLARKMGVAPTRFMKW